MCWGAVTLLSSPTFLCSPPYLEFLAFLQSFCITHTSERSGFSLFLLRRSKGTSLRVPNRRSLEPHFNKHCFAKHFFSSAAHSKLRDDIPFRFIPICHAELGVVASARCQLRHSRHSHAADRKRSGRSPEETFASPLRVLLTLQNCTNLQRRRNFSFPCVLVFLFPLIFVFSSIVCGDDKVATRVLKGRNKYLILFRPPFTP